MKRILLLNSFLIIMHLTSPNSQRKNNIFLCPWLNKFEWYSTQQQSRLKSWGLLRIHPWQGQLCADLLHLWHVIGPPPSFLGPPWSRFAIYSTNEEENGLSHYVDFVNSTPKGPREGEAQLYFSWGMSFKLKLHQKIWTGLFFFGNRKHSWQFLEIKITVIVIV